MVTRSLGRGEIPLLLYKDLEAIRDSFEKIIYRLRFVLKTAFRSSKLWGRENFLSAKLYNTLFIIKSALPYNSKAKFCNVQ